jgi:hypothetical protein
LVADRNMEAVVASLLGKHEALGTREIQSQIIRHPQHDPGCYRDATPLLSVFANQARQALVLLDRDWDGVPNLPSRQIEAEVESRIAVMKQGWARCIVIEPELEAWLFTRSPRLDEAVGWRGRAPSLSEALANANLWSASEPKPSDPKATMKWALSQVGKQTSSSIYGQIALHLGVGKCVDPSFLRFRSTLQEWFPAA